MQPISVSAVDNHGNVLFNYAVPFVWGINVQQILERAYAGAQTPAAPDPFAFTLSYYGYSTSELYPGYLGYELISINSLTTTNNFYWSLAVDGQLSMSGIDTTFPQPGAKVMFTYTAIEQQALTPRQSVLPKQGR